MSMRTILPNFFIIGAPKSATTALFTYLSAHPQVFMPRWKEPHYFANDLTPHPAWLRDWRRYLDLFAPAPDGARAIGEASVLYLFSRGALPAIEQTCPGARLICLIRDPVEMARAVHRQNLYNLEEDVADFATAWRLQEARARGQHLPRTVARPEVLQYRDFVSTGSQLHRALAIVPRERLLILRYDHFVADPRAVWRSVLDFLGLDDDGRREFPVVNERRAHGNPLLAKLVMRPPRLLGKTAALARRVLNTNRLGIGSALLRLTRVRATAPPLDPAFRADLVAELESEYHLLERIMDADLSTWRVAPPERN